MRRHLANSFCTGKGSVLKLLTAQCRCDECTHFFLYLTHIDHERWQLICGEEWRSHFACGRCVLATPFKRSYCFIESANRNESLDFFERVLAKGQCSKGNRCMLRLPQGWRWCRKNVVDLLFFSLYEELWRILPNTLSTVALVSSCVTVRNTDVRSVHL